MKKVFASDFDGTLYFYKAEDDRKLPAENVEKIREYMRETYGDIKLYGIGDSINDLPLLEASDVSYTFHYAPKVVQDKATKVVDTIVDALEDSMQDEV